MEPEKVGKEDEQPAVMNIYNPPDINISSQSSLRRKRIHTSHESMAHLIGGQIIRTLNNDKSFLGGGNYPELKESEGVATKEKEMNPIQIVCGIFVTSDVSLIPPL